MLGARGPRLEVVADATFLTEPVSCEVSNAVGSANRSTALEVLCEQGRGRGCGRGGRGWPKGGARACSRARFSWVRSTSKRGWGGGGCGSGL